MIDPDGGTAYDDFKPADYKREISSTISDIVTEQSDLKKKIGIGVQNQFTIIGQTIGQTINKITEAIEIGLACGCKAEQIVEQKIRVWIESRLNSVELTLQGLKSKIFEIERKLHKQAKKSIKDPADEPGGNGPKEPRIPTDNNIPPITIQQTVETPSVVVHIKNEPFPPPPKIEVVTNVYLPQKDGGQELPAIYLPPDLWDKGNDFGFFLSLEPSIVTIAEIAGTDQASESISLGKTVYLNATSNMNQTDVASVLDTFNIDPGKVQTFNVQQMWDNAVTRYGDTLSNQVFNTYNLPHPPITPVLGPIPPINASPTQTQQQSFGGVSVPISTPGSVSSPIPQSSPGENPSIVNQLSQSLSGLSEGLRSGMNFRFPVWCELVKPFAESAQYPPELAPGCATIDTIDQAANAIIQRLVRSQ